MIRNQSSIKSLFISEYHRPLQSWGARLADIPAGVITICRKAPRLLELCAAEGIMAPQVLKQMVGEQGFLLEKQASSPPASICQADDMIIVGSTFDRLARITKEHSKAERVEGLPFALVRSSLDRRPSTNISPEIFLEEDEYTSFVNAEISTFAILDKPYEVDHPILYLQLSALGEAARVESVLREVAKTSGGHLLSTPRRWMRADHSVYKRDSWTLLAPASDSARNREAMPKIRCYFSPELNRLTVMPIAPRAGTVGDLEALAKSHLPDGVAASLEEISSRLRLKENASKDLHGERHRAYVTWINYFLELVELSFVLRKVTDAFSKHGLFAQGSYVVNEFDLQLLAGRELAATLKRSIDQYCQDGDFGRRSIEIPFPLPRVELRAVLPENRKEEYYSLLQKLLKGVASMPDAVEAVFKAQHVALELPTRKPLGSAPDHNRLEFGVPFLEIEEQVMRTLPTADPLEFHAAMDMSIDLGTIVPRFLPTNPDATEPSWFRSFRVGEGQARSLAHVLRESLVKLADAVTPDTPPETVALPEVLLTTA